MELECEAVGEQFLHHDAELLVVGYAVLVGDAGDVEAVLVHPVGTVDYLFCMDVVGERDEVGERAVHDFEVAALQRELLHAGGAGVVGLMVMTSKAGSASGAMSLGGGGGAGISQAVSLVARMRVSGIGLGPWVQVPVMVLPSALRVPV